MQDAVNYCIGKFKLPDSTFLELAVLSGLRDSHLEKVYTFFERFIFTQTFHALEETKNIITGTYDTKIIEKLQCATVFIAHLHSLMLIFHREAELDKHVRDNVYDLLAHFFSEVKLDIPSSTINLLEDVKLLKDGNFHSPSTQAATEPTYGLVRLLHLIEPLIQHAGINNTSRNPIGKIKTNSVIAKGQGCDIKFESLWYVQEKYWQ